MRERGRDKCHIYVYACRCTSLQSVWAVRKARRSLVRMSARGLITCTRPALSAARKNQGGFYNGRPVKLVNALEFYSDFCPRHSKNPQTAGASQTNIWIDIGREPERLKRKLLKDKFGTRIPCSLLHITPPDTTPCTC